MGAAAARAGNEPAIGELIERHRADLRLYCYLMLGCPVKADAAVRETVLRAGRGVGGRAGGSGGGAVVAKRTWLYRIATRACVEELGRDR
jgi:RNA polymerase sigma-70 factor (ECF subfamily)